MIGAFDTKGHEYALLRQRLLDAGLNVIAVDTGVMPADAPFRVDVAASDVATAGGADLSNLRQNKDRGAAMKAMSQGAAAVAKRLHGEGRLDGIIGMGGTGGSSVVTAAMRALPLGVPKVCLSTIASGDTSSYVGSKDITLIPSIVDVAGVNRISRMMIAQAAAAITGMVNAKPVAATEDRPIIAASMFGNTTECVNACSKLLDNAGFEVLVFHATGTGGRTMESLVDEGLIDSVLDITTTEWADTICGGIFDAGRDRLSAPGRRGIPHLIVPGCVDMCNFGPRATVPQKYNDRLLYEWNPSVTLMRTTVDENREMGRIFAEKANASTGPVAFLLPLRGVSILDGDGQLFCDRAADQAMFDAIKQHVRPNIPVIELDNNINDAAFAERAVGLMMELRQAKEQVK
jgi:uncharacterized protein (UPF0261 family)